MHWHIWDFPKNIFVLIREEVRNDFFKEMYRKFGNQRKYAIFLKKDRTSIQGYHYARGWNKKQNYVKFIPLEIIQKSLPFISENMKEQIENGILEIRTRGGKSIKNPILPIVESEALFRIIAHLIGDGNDSHTPYYANTCKVLRSQFEEDLKIFGNVENYESNSELTPCINFPKTITNILRYVLDIRFTHPNKLPEIIFTAPINYKKTFIQAIFDDEGTISANLAIGMSNKRIITEIKQLLNGFKIKTGVITAISYSTKKGMKKKYSFNIFKKSYLDFYNKINFSHPEKVNRLFARIKAQQRSKRTRPKEFFEQEILNFLKIGDHSTMQIADKLELGMTGINPHLNRLYQEGKIDKKGYKNKKIWIIIMV